LKTPKRWHEFKYASYIFGHYSTLPATWTIVVEKMIRTKVFVSTSISGKANTLLNFQYQEKGRSKIHAKNFLSSTL
jgi:hypothetical protein